MRGWQYRSLNKGLQLLPCMHGDNLNKNNIVGLRKILEHYFVTRTIDYKSGLIFPLTHLLGRPYGSAGDLIFLPVMFFFISPPLLRAPLADRRATLPRDRKLAEFYNTGPKIRGRSPKKLGGKTCKMSVNFIQPQTLIANIKGQLSVGIAAQPINILGGQWPAHPAAPSWP